MKKRTAIGLTLIVLSSSATFAKTAQAAPQGRQLINAGSTSFREAAAGDGVTNTSTELAPEPGSDVATPIPPPATFPGKQVDGLSTVTASPSKVPLSFTGLTHRQQRLANGGNQFSLEPPDQGLCAGNGFVLESTNDVLRVFDTTGAPLTGVIDLNTFYGYPAAINRTTRARGPFVTDPVCYFDPDIQRFIHVILTIDVNPTTGAFLGSNHLDIAVSTSSSPLGAWNLYKLPVQDDGTEGTPNHHCEGGPCLGDYPHLGADANGIYLSTNEYALFGNGYNGSQVYAISKAELAAGVATPRVTQMENLATPPYLGFTVWPATAPVGANDSRRGGTEYFLSSIGGDGSESQNTAPFADKVVLWALTNTSSLNSSTPALTMSFAFSDVDPYAMPSSSTQKVGSTPLRDCINDTTSPTPFGPGCWNFLLVTKPPAEPPAKVAVNDGRMQQVTYYNGRLFGALDTKVQVEGADGHNHEQSAAEWFSISPKWEGRRLRAETKQQDYVAVPDNNVSYPAIGINASGKMLMTFSLVGKDHYPSAAYVSLDRKSSAVQIIAEGVGPQDGFSGYNALSGSGIARPRWGDYSTTAIVGNTIWVASEYIAQSCTLAEYMTPPFGSCGGTRTTLANWATRVSAITP